MPKMKMPQVKEKGLKMPKMHSQYTPMKGLGGKEPSMPHKKKNKEFSSSFARALNK